jgi:spore coat protein CotH
MAKTKKCSLCGELKPTTQFYICKSNKDGYQYRCKSCSDLNSKKVLKGDKSGIIYKIDNPIGQTYIGKTKRTPQSRWSDHKSKYKHQKLHALTHTFPLLHDSFDKFGVENHTFNVLLDLGDASKQELRDTETKMIQLIKKTGKSLNKYN